MERSGGEVRVEAGDENNEKRQPACVTWVTVSHDLSASSPEEQVARVYAAGQRGPGLGVTRALGDAAAKCCGIIATPQAWQGFCGRVHMLAHVYQVRHLHLHEGKEAPCDMCQGSTRSAWMSPYCSTARG